MTTTEEDLYAALCELAEASEALVNQLHDHEEPDQMIYDRYDDAQERARMVLARANRG
jgi:hypothetical protein